MTLNADGSFSYLPDDDFSGTDSFTYTASDGVATSAPATVTIVTSLPVATNDAYTGNTGQAVSGNVLNNATDAAGAYLNAGLVTAPAYGSLTLNPEGSFTYISNPGYSGPDAFTYMAMDALGAFSAPATVTIMVYSQPWANADAYTTIQGQTLTVNAPGVLGNDTNADGNPLTASLASSPANGQLTLHSDGSFSYTPKTGFSGTDRFTYTTTDGYATSLPATVTLTVYSIPVANADAYTTIQGQTLTVAVPGVLANDTNADGNGLWVSNYLQPAHGQVFLSANGSFSYLPAAGYSGIDSFTYTAMDGMATSAPATVTLTVYSEPLAHADAYSVVAGQTLKVNGPGVLANDTNADGGTLTATLVTTTAYGVVTLNPDGSFNYTPGAGYCGTDSFTYTATNGTAASAPATVTLTVYLVPMANADTCCMAAGQTLTVSAPGVLANDTNADGGALAWCRARPPVMAA